MKRSSFTLAVNFAMMLTISSCMKEPVQQPLEAASEPELVSRTSNVFKGPVVQIGDGHARSWIRINHDGMPEEIGVELTDAAFNSLPEHDTPLLLPLHKKAQEVTPFDHIGFNYTVHGH